ncbi:hypothetical protein D3C83_58290 [compost metagenome]
MISGTSASPKNSRLNGVLVRSFIHASAVPTTSEKVAVPAANSTELKNSVAVCRLVYALA